MGRIQVNVSMVDDHGRPRLAVAIDEVTRLDVDRDPLFVFVRVQAVLERALVELHLQALEVEQPARSTFSGAA